jgi:hypothetical protein
MCNAMKKIFEARWKQEVIGQVNNQVLVPNLAHDLHMHDANQKVNFK